MPTSLSKPTMGDSIDKRSTFGTSGGICKVSVSCRNSGKNVLNRRPSQQSYGSQATGGRVQHFGSTPLYDQQRQVESKDRVEKWVREPGKEAPWNMLTASKNGSAEAVSAVDAQDLGYAGKRRPRL